MSCYSLVTLPVEIKASTEEMQEALKIMGQDWRYVASQEINGSWRIAAGVDMVRLKRELARVKLLNEAKAQGYGRVTEERQGDKIVIRMRA